MKHGYAGRLLFVNLTTGCITTESPTEDFYRSCIGGTGLGAKIMLERTKGGIDPFGPENMLNFVTGPLTATGAYGGGRHMVTTKSPLTLGWADSNSGGKWGQTLRLAGYDGVFVSGIAERPVYLVIDSGHAYLSPADHLWGRDTHETDDLLQTDLGEPGTWSVACIGPSGEKRSLLAGIVNDKGRIAARSGVGAVMGAKRLKAVAIRAARGARIAIADRERLRQVQRHYLESIKESKFLQGLSAGGTSADLTLLLSVGDTPVENWTNTGTDAMPSIERLTSEQMDDYKLRRYGCASCPVRCGAIVKVNEGPFATREEMHRPEYETLGAFGTNCRNDNLESIIRANEICNHFGIDTIGVGGVISFSMECYENGLITSRDTGGLDLTWGNSASIVALTEQVARREGFGALLADGTRRAAEQIGSGAEEYAMHVGGRELPLHDPRFNPARGCFYISDATPAQHCGPQSMGMLDRGAPLGSNPLLQSDSPGPYQGYDRKGDIYARGAAHWQLLSSAGLCSLYSVQMQVPVVELLAAVTGWDIGWDEGLRAGKRVLTLRQAFNVREGLTPDDYKMPRRFREPLDVGPSAGQKIPFEILREGFFEAMNWDIKTGRPSANTLAAVGIDIG